MHRETGGELPAQKHWIKQDTCIGNKYLASPSLAHPSTSGTRQPSNWPLRIVGRSELEKQQAHSVGERETERVAKDLPFLAHPGTWRVQINVIPVPAAQAHSLRYADAAELIRQELALYPRNAEVHSPLLLPLKIRFIHHQMFYRPVTELWPQMVDLLNCCDRTQDPESYGEILFMLGGNLGTLRGNYEEARQFLFRAIRHARQRRDQYILARCLRKYGDFLRNRGHLQLARDVLLEALRLSGHGRGTRQRIYILGCLGDLERQKQNYAAASEHLERAVELARATFIPGWLGNLHLGLAELALDRNRFDEAKILLEQAEAHYRNTHPRHWWGEIQVGLSRCGLVRAAGSQE